MEKNNEKMTQQESTMSWQQQLCGKGKDITVWLKSDFGHCFEELAFICTAHALLAVLSVFYVAQWRRNCLFIVRRHWFVYMRIAVSLVLFILPALQLILTSTVSKLEPSLADICTGSIVCVSWLIHSVYVYRLQSMIWFTLRGPVLMNCSYFSTIAVFSIKVRSVALLRESRHIHYDVIEELISYITLCFQVLYLITLIPSEPVNVDVNIQSREGERLIPESTEAVLLKRAEDGNFLSKLTFQWVTPLMRKGARGQLNRSSDCFPLPKRMNPRRMQEKFREILENTVTLRNKPNTVSVSENWENPNVSINEPLDESMKSFADNSYRKRRKPTIGHYESQANLKTGHSILIALHKAFGVEYYLLGSLKLIADAVGFAGPILLNRLVSYMESEIESETNGYYYALGMFFSTIIAALCNVHFTYRVTVVGYNMRIGLITTIYRKTVCVNSLHLSKFTSGEIVNFMSTDTDRIVNFCFSFHSVWSLPFQIGVSLYLLYLQVGVSFLAGLAFAILLIPINKCLASKIGELSTKMMACKDQRVELMNELLRGIRVVKLYAWESHFTTQINAIRDRELRHLKGRKYLDAICVYFWATTPVLISILTFTTYSLLGNTLTAAKVFTSLALFLMLISPLNAFPWVLNGLVEAWVSLKRVQAFINLPNIDHAQYYSPCQSTMYDGTSNEDIQHIQIRDASFTWKIPPSSPTQHKFNNSVNEPAGTQDLEDINLDVQQGAFIGICSKVGGGKSSLISAILGEMGHNGGDISVSCLPDGFALASQEPWLQHATIRDNILFGSEMKYHWYQKVIDAAALSPDFQILKDGELTEIGEQGVTLSGGQKARIALARALYQDKQVYLLDDPFASVDAHVAKQLYTKCIMGLLRHKTRIVCTHHVKFLQDADTVIVMDKGRIVKSGPPNQVLSGLDISANLSTSESTVSSATNPSNDPDPPTQLVEEEVKDVGVVKMKVYKSYWKVVGNCLAFSILLSFFLMQASRNMNDWWLSYWVSHSNTHPNSTITNESLQSAFVYREHARPWRNLTEPSDNINFYLMVYGSLAASNSVFTLFRAFLFAYGGIKAASLLHKNLLTSILAATMKFFEETPIGRILNRFSSDLYTIDDSLPFVMNILITQMYAIVGTIVVTCYGLPWFAVLLVPLGVVYYFIQRYYRQTSREVKRIASITLSPIYVHFSESIAGLMTIRAFRAVPRFMNEYLTHVEVNQRAHFCGRAVASWLDFRLQMMGVSMVTGVAFIAVLERHFHTVNPGLVGLAISYALSITSQLNGVVVMFTQTEKQMISVERAQQFIDDVPKETNTPSLFFAPPNWPRHGCVRFHRVFLRYRPDLPYALNSVSFLTQHAEKIGIVGRTGSGKSSLFAALFRLVEIEKGEIDVDDISMTGLDLTTIRSQLSIIPQDPFIFSGTVRCNLDPTSIISDLDLWRVLHKCHLSDVIERLGGLDAQVEERGRVFSVGQRQLVCLARAMLKHSKVLCIDEATASVDLPTSTIIQETIRQEFSQSTILTIAHRIDSILDSDRVIVMANGKIAEFDPPKLLLQDKMSLFYGLVHGHS